MKVVIFKEMELLDMQIALLQCIFFAKKNLEEKEFDEEYKNEIKSRIEKYNKLLKKLGVKEK